MYDRVKLIRKKIENIETVLQKAGGITKALDDEILKELG